MAKTNAASSIDETSAAYQEGRASGRSRLANNPVGVLVGGFVVGAVVGAVLPTSSRERKALQPLGAKVSDAARSTAHNVAETGRDKLNKLTGEVVTQVGSKVVDAVSSATETAKS